MLHELRRGQRGEIANRRLFVPDFDALAQVAAFDARYLHGGEAAQLPARASALFDKDEPTGVRPSTLGAPPTSSYPRRTQPPRQAQARSPLVYEEEREHAGKSRAYRSPT